MVSTELKGAFLQLVRLGIGHTEASVSTFQAAVDWEGLKALADAQGLSAIVLEGLNYLRLPNDSIPKKLRLEWIGQVLKGYKYRYELYRKAIGGLAGFYNAHGIKMMVLKGYACALDWPKSEHRPCGDIDIWLFGKQEFADKELEKRLKGHGLNAEIDTGHHHHTVFQWNGFMVENHYDFINTHHHKLNVYLEKILKELADEKNLQCDHYQGGRFACVEVCGQRIYLPSANLHALFLIRHASAHFASTGINLRQILDWGFFVEKHENEIDWFWLIDLLEKYGMKRFFDLVNAICIEELGFSYSHNLYISVDKVLKDRVLNEMLEREFEGKTPSNFIKRIFFKFRRWIANGWKHQLCYKDSMWSAFWSGVWSHLLKPSSI